VTLSASGRVKLIVVVGLAGFGLFCSTANAEGATSATDTTLVMVPLIES